MNIKKSQLSEIIKAVVRQTIKERKQKLHEEQMQEVAPPGWGPDKKHAKLYNKIKAQYPNNDAAAYATMWKVHKKLEEALHEAGLTSEASYKVVSPTQTQVQKDDQARRVQTEPTVNEEEDEGWIKDFFERVPQKDLQFIEDLMKKHNLSLPQAVRDYVEMYGHEQGQGTPIKMREASYKVVAPMQTRVQKDDHARKVQTEPKVTENHKVQHRSACTVKDLPNDPKNVRDPEVPNC